MRITVPFRFAPLRRRHVVALAAGVATTCVTLASAGCSTSTDGYDIVRWCQSVADTAPRAAEITQKPGPQATTRALLVPEVFTGADPAVIRANEVELNKILRLQASLAPPRLKAAYGVLIDSVEDAQTFGTPETQRRIAEAERRIAAQAQMHCKPGGVQERTG